jgi:C-terminal processing protease CtpA/Prc
MIRKALLMLSLALLPSAALAGEKLNFCYDVKDQIREAVAHMNKMGWVGIEMEHNEDYTLTLKRIVPDSPAERAGLRVGDVLVAREGVLYTKENGEKISRAHKKSRPGDRVTFTVRRGSQELPVTVELGRLPEQVIAQWIGSWAIESAEVELAEKK